jgi:Ammonium Transporter Family
MRVDYDKLDGSLDLSRNFSVPMSAMITDPDLMALCLKQANLTSVDQNVTAILNCFAKAIGPDLGSRMFIRSIGLVFAGSLVFFMQAGFAMLCAGAVRKKNVQNTLLKNLLDACGASIAWFCVGYAFAFGGSQPLSPVKTFIGTSNFFFMDVKDPAYWFFQYAFSAASATIIAGTLAERCQMAAYFGYSIVLVGWVYPVIVHAIWSPNGFLAADNISPLLGVGMVDFAGSGVVHLTGGVTALFATIILGPRRGRFHDETGRKLDKPREFLGNSMSLQVSPVACGAFDPAQAKNLTNVPVVDLVDAGHYCPLVWVVWLQQRFCLARQQPRIGADSCIGCCKHNSGGWLRRYCGTLFQSLGPRKIHGRAILRHKVCHEWILVRSGVDYRRMRGC